jgi:hypothetical protein
LTRQANHSASNAPIFSIFATTITTNNNPTSDGLAQVHIKAGFILNGVCVLWRGWIDLQRLEGFGCLEFDEYRAYLEDAMVKQSIDKQQTCNSLANNQTNSIGRLNHHLGAAPLLPPQSFNPATAAAAVAAITTNSMIPPPPLGLNCLGAGGVGPIGPPPPPPPAPQSAGQPSGQVNNSNPAAGLVPPPPVSLAESAAHYGNAALAAAAAAAFHQALSIGGQPPPPPPSQSLGLPGTSSSSSLAGVSHLPLVPQHLPYSNGSNIIPTRQRSNSPPLTSGGSHHHTSPQHHHFLNDTQATANSTNTNATTPQSNGNSSTSMQHNNQTNRSPERENHNHHNHHHHHNNSSSHQHHQALNANSSSNNNNNNNYNSIRRQATKRAPEELAASDEVDVVSDINVHELDLPPRRIFKSEPITTSHLSQKAAARRAV